MTAWRPVPGWETFYEVSDDGQVRSIGLGRKPNRPFMGRILRPGTNTSGYHYVHLSRPGHKQTARVHCLVAAAFIGPRPDGLQVCHGDGVKTNNRVANLRYDTAAANQADLARHGGQFYLNKTHCPQGHPYSGDNLVIEAGRFRRCLTCRRARDRARHAGPRADVWTEVDTP